MQLVTSDLGLEKLLLAYIISDEKYIKEMIERVEDEAVFSDERCRDIFCHIRSYYNRYNTFPTYDILKSIFSDVYQDDIEKLKETKLFIKQLKQKELNSDDFKFIIDKVIFLHLQRKLLAALESSGKSSSDIHKAYENIETAVLTTNKAIKIQNYRKIELGESFLDRLKYYEAKQHLPKGISSGIVKLDEITGGWRPGNFIIVTTVTGEGKSALLLNFGENANKISKVNVALVSLEMSYEEELERYHSMITGVDYQKIRKRECTDLELNTYYRRLCLRMIDPEQKDDFRDWFKKQNTNKIDFNELEKTVRTKFKIRPQKFYIFDIPRVCTTKLLEMEIRNILRKEPCPLFIIDHLHVMEPTVHSKNQWQDYGQIARELKGLARDYKITILTAAQLGQIKEGEKVTTDNIKYAKRLAEEADFVIGFKVTAEDKLLHRIRLELTKHRHTEESTIPIRQMFSQMKITNYDEIIGEDIQTQPLNGKPE